MTPFEKLARPDRVTVLYWDHVVLPFPTRAMDVLIASDGDAITGLRFGVPADHAAWLGDALRDGGCDPVRRAAAQLGAYAAGRRTDFDLALRAAGTAFQLDVWEALLAIPYGETASYGEVARRLGRPRQARAVGAAVGANPLGIVVPCHRVIGADGSLTGFGGGLDNKMALLSREGVTAL